jgi:hypothetical protein
MKRRRTLLTALGLLSLGLGGCASQQRTMPIVVLEKDFFGGGLPKEDRCFVSIANPITEATAARAKVVYFRVSTPPGIRAESREQHVATVLDALRRLGVLRLVSVSELQTLVQARGAKFSFDREPDPSEWSLAEKELGPFMVLHVEYGIVHGSRRYVRIQAQDSTQGSLLFDGSYDTIIWNDVKGELFYPAMNLYANWINDKLRLRS